MFKKYYFLIFFIVIFVKLIAIFYTNLDLFGDEAQYWIWSQKLDFGYYSKPPLLAWIISGVTYLFGNDFVVLKLIPFFIYFLTSYLVFLLYNELYKKKEVAIIAGISFFLLPAVSVSSFLLSTDIVLLFFWSLSLLFLLKIREDPKFINFLLLGIFLGLSLLAKYAAIYFIISLTIIAFYDKKTKHVFKKNYLYLLSSFLTAFLILLPNIIWNNKNNWATINHTSDNANLNNINFNIFQGFEFLMIQGIMIGPLLLIFFLFFMNKIKFIFETKFLLSFSLPIFVLVFFESILVRANANWAAVALIPFFIFMFNHVYNYYYTGILLNNIFNFIFCVIFFILIAISPPIKIFNRINGISSFSNLLKTNYAKKHKHIVIQDRLLYSSLRYSLKDSNKILLMPWKENEKITNHFQLSDPLMEMFNKNFIFIGDLEKINYLSNKNKTKSIDKIEVIFKEKPIEIYEVIF